VDNDKSDVIFDAISQNKRLSGLENIGFKEFEELFGTEFKDIPKSALPPITRADFQEERPKPSYFKLFETLSLSIRQIEFDNSTPPKRETMRTFSAADVRAGILKFIQTESDLRCQTFLSCGVSNADSNVDDQEAPNKTSQNNNGQKVSPDSPDTTRPNTLKLIGCRIKGDLDLSNFDFPGSIRLMGCLIEGALILDRTKLVTLDLSGSLIQNGVSAMYLNARGAVRLRRTVSQGPVDMGGLIAHGTVDFTDSILFPANTPSPRASYVGDRGILNLAQSKLDKDLRFERARIYGGINMRGATIGGMLHFNDAILRSALAHFENLVIQTIREANKRSLHERKNATNDSGLPLTQEEVDALAPLICIDTLRRSALMSVDAVLRMAKHLHPCRPLQSQEEQDEFKKYHGVFAEDDERWRWEKLGDGLETELSLVGPNLLQRRLVQGSREATEAALRAEQVTVHGPLYARGIRVCGSLRMKRMQTNGTLGLNGARLRSANDVRDSLLDLYERTDVDNCAYSFLNMNDPNDEHLESTLVNMRHIFSDLKTYLLRAGDVINRGGTDYVLNLDHATIRGDLDVSRDQRPSRVVKTMGSRLREHLELASETLVQKYGSEDCLPEYFRKEYYSKGEDDRTIHNPTLIIGDVKLDNVTVEGSVDFRDTIFNLSESYSKTKKKSIRARNAKIRLHLDLRQSAGLNGICLTSASVGGSVKCFEFTKADLNELKTTSHCICHPIFEDMSKTYVAPDFDLDLASISGSALLLFHPLQGPNISATQTRIGSKTYILPTDGFSDRRSKALEETDVTPPKVDMTGLQTPFLSHNPGAWPASGNLVIRNLKYEATDDLGHLFPRTRDLSNVEEERKKNNFALLKASVVTVLIVAFVNLAGIVLGAAVTKFIPQGSSLTDVGELNIIIAMCIVAIVSFAKLVEIFSRPLPYHSKPLALYWLGLQGTHINTRHINDVIRPAEPFIRAAAVLRAESRSRSANRVDVERLRVKRRALWSRTSWPARLFLKIVDVFIGYGYRPVRGIALTLIYIMGAGMAFNVLKTNGIILPAETVELLEERRVLGRHFDRNHNVLDDSSLKGATQRAGARSGATVAGAAPRQVVDQDGGTPSEISSDTSGSAEIEGRLGDYTTCNEEVRLLSETHFHSLAYTLDAFIPFIDMDVESEWKTVDPDRLSFILSCSNSQPLEDKRFKDFLYIVAIGIKLFGWLLITTLAFSLLTRFETLLIRPNN